MFPEHLYGLHDRLVIHRLSGHQELELVYAGGVYVFVRHAFYEVLDDRLRGDCTLTAQALKIGEGQRAWRNRYEAPSSANTDSLWVLVWETGRSQLICWPPGSVPVIGSRCR